MSTFRKIISVLLSILIISSFAAVAASAEDSDLSEAAGTTETAEIIGEEGTEQIDDGQQEETPAPETAPAEKQIYSYKSNLIEVVGVCVAAISGIVTAPVGIATLSVAFTPAVVLLPITLPIACILGLLSFVAGAAGLMFSPVIAAVTYAGQF